MGLGLQHNGSQDVNFKLIETPFFSGQQSRAFDLIIFLREYDAKQNLSPLCLMIKEEIGQAERGKGPIKKKVLMQLQFQEFC